VSGTDYRKVRNRAIVIYAAVSAVVILVLYFLSPLAALLFGLVVVPQVGRILLWILLRRRQLESQGTPESLTTASGFADL
jgi:Flp pilus assembly protein TadB